jgi:bifunctional ADP-heptose synthase (sugar kinase/adenylyltransferase)
VIGDTILDEYQYCDAIGKSSKDPVLAVKYKSHDLFAGGVLAVANHVANFAKMVQLVTVLGEQNSYEEFIRSQLQPNISPYFVFRENAPTLIKRRFVEAYSLNKLFEVYVMNDSQLSAQEDKEVCDWIRKNAPNYDIVIAADFGHGAISEDMIQTLINHSRFLAINTQANAGNRGFNTISRYPRGDYVCLAEHEIRLETRNMSGDLRPMMTEMAKKLNCHQFIVTRGRQGAAICDHQGGYVSVPSFARNVVDRVGAGDAFFALTSLAAFLGVPNEILGFIGNVTGSLAVEILGNKKSVDKLSIKKYITSLMK